MKTETLITLLATDVLPAGRHAFARRFACALIAGLSGATLLVLVFYGVRADIGEMRVTPLFWIKVAFPASLAIGAVAMTARLSRPGAPPGNLPTGLVFPVGSVWAGGFALWWLAPPETRSLLLMGHTWRSCPFNIAFLSIPGFIATFQAVRGLAPTRARPAGAAAGLTAGATATIAYCLHCPEMGVPFWAVWYVLGMTIPTAMGALMGPRWLRW